MGVLGVQADGIRVLGVQGKGLVVVGQPIQVGVDFGHDLDHHVLGHGTLGGQTHGLSAAHKVLLRALEGALLDDDRLGDQVGLGIVSLADDVDVLVDKVKLPARTHQFQQGRGGGGQPAHLDALIVDLDLGGHGHPGGVDAAV